VTYLLILLRIPWIIILIKLLSERVVLIVHVQIFNLNLRVFDKQLAQMKFEQAILQENNLLKKILGVTIIPVGNDPLAQSYQGYCISSIS
jgi:uncharacterized protein YdiU (UPF0061 family)